jgi:ABC-2 type transport system ATP-binding protein
VPVTTPAIRVRGLTKVYGRTTGVDALTFDVPHGIVFGYLGPNGAGKTTTMRLLLGLLRPTRGSAQIAGHDVWSDRGAATRSPAICPVTSPPIRT